MFLEIIEKKLFELFSKKKEQTGSLACNSMITLPMFWKQATSDDVTAAFADETSLQCKNEFGEGPLRFAAKWGNEEALTTLVGLYHELPYGGDYVDKQAMLVDACDGDNTEVIGYLLTHGAKPTDYCLIRCASSANIASVKAMLEAGADPNLYSEDNPHLWKITGRPDRAPLVAALRTDTSAEDVNLRSQKKQIASELLKAGAQVNVWQDYCECLQGEPPIEFEHSYNPLNIAAAYYDVDMVREIIDAGADVTANNNAALHCAIQHGKINVIKLLLDSGAAMWNEEIADASLSHVVKRRNAVIDHRNTVPEDKQIEFWGERANKKIPPALLRRIRNTKP